MKDGWIRIRSAQNPFLKTANQPTIYIYVEHYLVETDIYTLLVCLSVCLYAINVQTAEPI